MARKFVILAVLFVFLSVLIFYREKQAFFGKDLGGKSLLIPNSQTEFGAFSDMTILSLRSRVYKSKLGSSQKIGDNGIYTSYLTSYESDGNKINALLTVPDSAGKHPGIVFVHGYIPPNQYVTTEKYVDYVDYLARNGFVVFKIDLRGHGDSEGVPGGGYFGSDYVVDSLNAQAALESSNYVKKGDVGFWGHSMAGNIVMRSIAARPQTKAAVIWAGAVYSYIDQGKYGINDNSYRPPITIARRQNSRRVLYEKYGSPSASSKFWQQVAPTSYLSDLKGAIEIHHAVDDTVVNIGYSRDLMKLLDKTKVPHEFYEYPTGGHNINGESFDLAIQRTVEFFKKYLH